jgi:ribonuclease T1
MIRCAFALLLSALVGLTQAQEISRADLPAEAHETLSLIAQGGPFPHRRDGIVFQNRERLLPQRPRGHYREYTVATPGLKHRGARRIVCGGQPPTQPEACWYTADHYRSFRIILP